MAFQFYSRVTRWCLGMCHSHLVTPTNRVSIIITRRDKREVIECWSRNSKGANEGSHSFLRNCGSAVMCNRQSKYVRKRCSLVWCVFSIKITPLMLARSCSLSLASRLKLLHQWNIWFGFSFCFLFFFNQTETCVSASLSKRAAPMGCSIFIFAQVCLEKWYVQTCSSQ